MAPDNNQLKNKKNFAGLAKDTKKNRIYSSSSTYRILAGSAVFLLVLDKKETPKTGIPSYSFMDLLGQRMREKDIRFCSDMSTKGQRDEVALRAFNTYQRIKAERWKVYKKAARGH